MAGGSRLAWNMLVAKCVDANPYARHWSRQPFHGLRSVVACHEELAHLLQPLFRESALSRLLELTRHRHPFGRAVDLGCGSGDWTLRYTAIARRVVGIDINPHFIDEARRVASSAGHDIDFRVAAIGDFDDFQDASLVCMTACAMYLEDEELERVVDRVARAQGPGDVFYLRATVVNPLRRPHRNQSGVYRRPGAYETLLRARGYRIRERMFAASYVPIFLARHGLGLRTFTAARILTAGLTALLRLGRMTTRTNFCSWVFEKR